MAEGNRLNNKETLFLDDHEYIPTGHRHPYLVIFIGQDSGMLHKLEPGQTTIGRSPETDITIEDERISRLHCVIERVGDTIAIEDRGSKNGTHVDCCKVKRSPISPGVPIQIGQSVMKIEYKNDAEVRVAQDLLRRAAVDGLTGTFKLEHFTKLAAMEMAYSCRHQRPLAIIMMSIDNFRQVNVTYGQHVGDLVLSRFAGIVGETNRKEDLFGRYTDEKFIVMPRGELNEKDLYSQCERIRKTIEKCKFRFGMDCVRVTVSLGFHLEETIKSAAETVLLDIIGKADQALDLAKQRGRNRIEGWR
jgi:diguanylate cyclase (GGDEF)-like protein